MRYILILALMGLCGFGCTEAERGKYAVLGNSSEVTCYSGGKVYFHARSTGKVSNEQNSDGFFARWTDLEGGEPTGKPYYASISGDCKIVYLED